MSVKTFLVFEMLNRKTLFFLFIIIAACSPGKDIPEDESVEHVLDYGFTHGELAPNKPYDVLPAGKIPESKYRILPSLDTVSIHHVFDSIPGKAFIFMPRGTSPRQTIAVKRTNDWLLLDWSIFHLSAPAGLKPSFVDINGNGSPELMLSLDVTTDSTQMMSEHGIDTDAKGNSFFTSRVFKKAKGFCLIDLDSISFLAQNVFTGYEYYYETALRFQELREKDDTKYYVNGLKNTYRTIFRVWYNFEIMPGENIIMVTLDKCEMEKTLDDGTIYFDDADEDDEPDTEQEDFKKTCTPVYVPGLYEFKDGAFRLQQ